MPSEPGVPGWVTVIGRVVNAVGDGILPANAPFNDWDCIAAAWAANDAERDPPREPSINDVTPKGKGRLRKRIVVKKSDQLVK